MTLDICIPCFKNVNCLRVASRGLLRSLGDCLSLGKVILYIQDSAEAGDVSDCFNYWPRASEMVVTFDSGAANMSDILNRMASEATADWILFTEQDVFLHAPIAKFVARLDMEGFIAAGPVDTFHYSHPNARGHAFYGDYARLSPAPGYFHSSLILVKREAISNVVNPFSVPTGFLFQGHGILGAECYYGLRLKIGQEKDNLAFLHQEHGEYGYCANISWGGRKLATHLYYSGTKVKYLNEGFISQRDHDWLVAEEQRFLKDYER